MEPGVELSEMETPTQMMNWSPGLVGDLFDKAAAATASILNGVSADRRTVQSHKK